MYVYINSMFYSLFLIFFCMFVLSYLTLIQSISPLVCFAFLIVYLGAIIVIIGYICCVTPNINMEPNYKALTLLVIPLIRYYVPVANFYVYPNILVSTTVLGSSLYSQDFIFILFIIIISLFLTLLRVTTPPTPQGPFRSV